MDDASILAGPDGAEIREMLVQSMRSWGKRPARQKAWLLGTECGQCDYVRLERGNANAGRYDVVWIYEDGDEARVISSIDAPAGEVKVSSVPISAWQALEASVLSATADGLRCPSDKWVADGSSYVLSYRLDGHSAELAAYGLLVPLDRTELQDIKRPQLPPCKALLRAVLDRGTPLK